MKRTTRNALIALPLAAAVTLGGAHLVQAYRSDSAFRPFAADRVLQNNQILFPDDAGISALDRAQTDKDRSFWEQDDALQNEPQSGAQDGYLFSQAAEDGRTAGLLSPDQTGVGGAAGSADEVYTLVDDRAQADVIIAGGGAADGAGTGKGGTDTPDSDAQPDSSATRPGGGSGSGTGGTDVVTPEQPSYGNTAKDPQTEKPMPSDQLYTNKKFTEDAFSGGSTARVVIGQSTDNENRLYIGQELEARTIYNALDTYVVGADTTRYLWDAGALGTYVRIDAVSFDGGEKWQSDFPLRVPESAGKQMTIRVSYRLSTLAGWTECEVPYVLERNRVLVLSEPVAQENAELDPATILNTGSMWQHLREGEKVNLLMYQSYLLGNSPLTSLFAGWMEDGKLVPWYYSADYGRHVLEPAARVALDARFTVELRLQWMSDTFEVGNQYYNLCYLQTLTGYSGEESVRGASTHRYVSRLTIPQYVQAVDLEDDEHLTVDQLNVPESVLYINTTNCSLRVEQSYSVAEGNLNYRTQNGILYDRAITQMLGIPARTVQLRVPESIQKVTLTQDSDLKQLVLLAQTAEALPEINYENIPDGCTLVLQDALVEDFLTEYRQTVEREHFYVAAASAPQNGVTVEQGLLVSADGAVRRVLSAPAGDALYLPEDVTRVPAGTLAELPETVVDLVLPRSGQPVTLESGWHDGTAITTILCHSQAQLDALAGRLPDGVTAALLRTSAEGYSYSVSESGGVTRVTLFGVPSNVVEFDGILHDEQGDLLALTEIGANAFANCEHLQWVTLPQGVQAIGTQAFSGCTALEGVLIDDREQITIGDGAFDGCTALRFVASNAAKCMLENGYTPKLGTTYSAYVSFLYAPTNNTGYNSNWTSFDAASGVDHYEVVKTGALGRVLYGLDDDGSPWLALRSGATVDDVLTLPETTLELFTCAFEGAGAPDGKFSLVWNSAYDFGYIDDAAFRNSQLGGSLTLLPLGGLGADVFLGCTELTSVEFTKLSAGATLNAGLFTGCESLTDLTLHEEMPPDTAGYNGIAFTFNGDWTVEEEAEHLRLHVPAGSEETYVSRWRYLNAGGYMVSPDRSAYENMWLDLYYEYVDPDTWEFPEEDVVDDALESRLLAAENRLRVMMGAEEAEELTDLYHFRVEYDDIFWTPSTARLIKTLPGLTDADLYGPYMGLPSDMMLTHIASGAFSRSTNLQSVTLYDGIQEIADGAFTGVSSGSITIDCSWLWTLPSLTGFEPGTPYSFGVPDEAIHIDTLGEWQQESIIHAWVLAMAGYEDSAQMREMIAEELGEGAADEDIDAAVTQALLTAENRLRAMLGMEQIEDPDDMIGLGDDTDEPLWGAWSDDAALPPEQDGQTPTEGEQTPDASGEQPQEPAADEEESAV